MLRTLRSYHERIDLGLGEIRRLCAAETPDILALERARASLSQVSVERSRFINQVVISRMLARVNYASSRDMVALQNRFAANRLVSTQHVRDWTSVTIAADWAGYCAAAAGIWQMMEQQMRDELTLVTTHLPSVLL